MKYLLSISIPISIVTYSFWGYFPKGGFYIGNALFIALICSYLFFTDRKNDVKFVLFALSLNNLADELIFDNTVLGWNELAFAVVIFLIFIFRKNDRTFR